MEHWISEAFWSRRFTTSSIKCSITIPSLTEFKQLFLQFPTASYISSFSNQLLIEFPLMDDANFERLLVSLPYSAGGLSAGCCNGAIFDTCRRVVELDPKQLMRLICDETNYLKNENEGRMRPGCAVFCPRRVQDDKAIEVC
jgi:hypothetical protein